MLNNQTLIDKLPKKATLYPDAEVISEIGGGLNFKRKKLQALLVRVMQGSIKRIIVAHKDRFARFGFDHFEWLALVF